MSLQPDQIHAAFNHALDVANLDDTAPAGLGQPNVVVPDLAVRRSTTGARRHLALAAGAVVVICGLGLAFKAAGSDGEQATGVAFEAATGPAVAAGLDDPTLTLIDTAEEPTPGVTPPRAQPDTHLEVLRSTDGRTIAVADRPTNGDGSLDRFPIEKASTVEGVEVLSSKETASDLAWGMKVSGWTANDRHVRVATRGLTQQEHDAQVQLLVLASLDGSLRGHASEGFAQQYSGPDENPFYGLPHESNAAYRDDDGKTVTVQRSQAVVSAAELARYAWYRTEALPTTIDGMAALIAEGDDGRASLYLARPDGLVIVSGPTGDLIRYGSAVVPLDAAGWASLRRSASDPGSYYQTSTATTEPP